MNYWTVFWLWQMATDYSDSLGLVEFALAQVYSVPKKLFHYGEFKLPIHPKLKLKFLINSLLGPKTIFKPISKWNLQKHVSKKYFVSNVKSWGCV